MGKPLKYDRTIVRYRAWIAEGFTRYRNHKATHAAIALAQQLLNYTPTSEFSYQRQTHNVLQMLKQGGVTPEAVLCRVAELCAWMEDNPGSLRTPREETFAVARLVVHLIKWQGRDYPRVGAKVLAFLGEMAQELVFPFCLGLVRKLRADQDAKGELLRQSADLG